MDLDNQQILLVALVLFIVWCYYQQNAIQEYFSRGKFPSPLLYDNYTSNRNTFRNFYRIGSELSTSVGWKPSMNWDHLRPESNDCPQCYPEEVERTLVST